MCRLAKGNRWIAFMAALALLVFVGSPAANAQALAKVNVAYSVIGGDPTMIWVAQEKGYFKKYGMETQLKYIAGSTQLTPALISGDVSFAQSGGAAVISADLSGADLVIIGSTAPVFVMSLFSLPDINSVADLKGKRIAVTSLGTTTDFARRVALQSAGLNPDRDVTVLQSKGVPETLAALISGNVAAGVVTPPQTLIARQQGLKELVNLSTAGVPYEQGPLVTTHSQIQKNPALVEDFMKAMVEAIAFAKQNRQETKMIMAKYIKNVDDTLLDEAYVRYVEAAYKKYPYPSLKGLQTALDFLVPNIAKAAMAKPEQFVDLSFLKRLEESRFADQFYK